MRYDAVVFGVHCDFGYLDLTLRLGSTVGETLFAPTAKTILFEGFMVTSLGLFALPFVLWKIPALGELVHQARAS